ncbi:MAG: alpha/beta hydrolase, partial [Alphaproteobacteria bacterium]
MSLRLRLAVMASRAFLKPTIARARDPARLRRMLRLFGRLAFREPPFTLAIRTSLGQGLPGLVVSNRPDTRPIRPEKAVLLLHGGGFVAGRASDYRPFAAWIARRTGCTVFVPDYRLAPEHPFPA